MAILCPREISPLVSNTMALTSIPIRAIGSSLPVLLSKRPVFVPTVRWNSSKTPPDVQPPLTKRAVVGSFLLKRDAQDGRPKVALFRRTDKVNTYR